jgi:hypothetical protein
VRDLSEHNPNDFDESDTKLTNVGVAGCDASIVITPRGLTIGGALLGSFAPARLDLKHIATAAPDAPARQQAHCAELYRK